MSAPFYELCQYEGCKEKPIAEGKYCKRSHSPYGMLGDFVVQPKELKNKRSKKADMPRLNLSYCEQKKSQANNK